MARKKPTKSSKSSKGKYTASKKSSNDFSLRLKANPDKQTKSQILTNIASLSGLNKKEVHRVFLVLANEIAGHMIKRGSGEFTIPETGIRVKRKTRPATKKRLGRNPATGEQIWISAKPARTVVKIVPLRALKETVAQ